MSDNDTNNCNANHCDNHNGNLSCADDSGTTCVDHVDQHLKPDDDDDDDVDASACSVKGHGVSKRRVTYMYSNEYIQVCDAMLRIPKRASMIHCLVEAFGLLKYIKICLPREATVPEVMSLHSDDYINFLKKINDQDDEEKDEEEAEIYGLTYDCPGHVGVYDYAVLVAGATVAAAETLVHQEADVAINWFGGWHHAKRDSASGFCYINDIVLGIIKLREKFDRVVYIDLDLHHGDGVEDAFCSTSKVLTVSFHKYLAGFFPGTGSVADTGIGRGKHYSVNVPLLDGLRDPEFVALFTRVMTRIREVFCPDAVVCQCGADGLAGDPMESFSLTHLGLGRSVQLLLDWNLPLLLLGGGGYNHPNTAKCWAYLTSLAVGKKLPRDIPDHEYLMEYGPDYEMTISTGNRKDCNTKEYLTHVYQQVMNNLDKIS
ncbi:histone deacetylase 8-like [Gigantopelta aegis]|uniref:histone deacetylase 8-like n=1 Tax=Gigantopelta aegis TaxID=1735272 RepID=UPI001B88B765|nr:histone deacetylase 8-like [Gigantopelta aegis]